MEEEETPDRVSEMLNQLGRTIQEFEVDITQSNNIMLQHIALRTVSYYMYHKTLSAAFSASQIETVLSAIIGTLFRTQNEMTFGFCIWCLTVENFGSKCNNFLMRMVEGLIYALRHPQFSKLETKKRALNGMVRLLNQHSSALVTTSNSKLWALAVAQELSSDSIALRHRAWKMLKGLSLNLDKIDSATMDALQKQLTGPGIETMKTVESKVEAVQIWGVCLLLLQHRLGTDPELFNKFLNVPDALFSYPDPAVRVTAFDNWRCLIDVFATTPGWSFKKHKPKLLMVPILHQIRIEESPAVLDSIAQCWSCIVAAATRDFHQTSKIRPPRGDWFTEIVQEFIRVTYDRKEPSQLIEIKIQQVLSSLFSQSENDIPNSETPSYDYSQDPDEIDFESLPLNETGENTFPESSDVTKELYTSSTTVLIPALEFNAAVVGRVLPSIFLLIQHLSRSSITTTAQMESMKFCMRYYWQKVAQHIEECTDVGFASHLAQKLITFTFQQFNTDAFQALPQDTRLQLLLDGVANLMPQVLMRTDLVLLLRYAQNIVHRNCAGALLIPKRSLLGILGSCSSLGSLILVDILISCDLEEMQRKFLEKIIPNGETVGEKRVWKEINEVWHKIQQHEMYRNQGSGIVKELVYSRGESSAAQNSPASSIQHLLAPEPEEFKTEPEAEVNSEEDSRSSGRKKEVVEEDSKDKGDTTESEGSSEQQEEKESVTEEEEEEFDSSKTEEAEELSAKVVDETLKEAEIPIIQTEEKPPSPKRFSYEIASAETKQGESETKAPEQESLSPSTLPSIYPELKDCQESVAVIMCHFPRSFRQLLSYYQVRTIGDLSSLPVSRVKQFGLKSPVKTVISALDDYKSRTQRRSSPAFSPSPSPRKRLSLRKSAALPGSGGLCTPSPIVGEKRSTLLRRNTTPTKRMRRQYAMLEASPKVAGRVTFQLDTQDGGSRIIRPGEDSQNQVDTTEDSSCQQVVRHLNQILTCLDSVAQHQEKGNKTSTEDMSKLSQANALVSLISTKLWKCAHPVRSSENTLTSTTSVEK